MRIAQIAPLFESVPPTAYGGTERIVSYITESLVKAGHDVTLFASGDSLTQAELVSVKPKSLRLHGGMQFAVLEHFLMFEELVRRKDDFDILHFHTDYMHFPFARAMGKPSITTLHGRLDLPQYPPLFKEYSELPLISISNSQRQPVKSAAWAATVYHGLPKDLYSPTFEQGSYAVFLGRISKEKRPDRAIEIAARAGLKLKIAAKVDDADKEYYQNEIEPLIARSPHVEFLGEVGDREKTKLLGQASVLLFPIDWPEPFGLVMIESMACGTPVIGFRCGSASEVIDDGVTGFLVDSVDEAVAKIPKAVALDRRRIRQVFDTRFSIEACAHAYLEVYQNVIQLASAQTSAVEVETAFQPFTPPQGAKPWKTFSNSKTKYT